jgi:uncharacterized membrane protein YtjA (UPF0391 family)
MSQQMTVSVGNILDKYLKLFNRNNYIEKKWIYHLRKYCTTGMIIVSRLTEILNGDIIHHQNYLVMLRWALIFFIVAIIAAIFGFGGIAAGAASIAKILFFIFLVLFLVSIIAGAVRR